MTSEHANDNWPLVLTRTQAAAMCGLTPSGFSSWVRRGIAPNPIIGTMRWSREAVSQCLHSNDNNKMPMSPFEAWKAEHARSS